MPSKDWSPRTIAKEKISDIVADALEDFWAKVARSFPLVTSGDLDPLSDVGFREHAFDIVVEWLSWNHPNPKVQEAMRELLRKRSKSS